MSGRHPRDQEISWSEMGSWNGSRWLIVDCSDFKCWHFVVIDAAQWGDDVVSDWSRLCKACGRHGADVRPLFEKARMGTECG